MALIGIVSLRAPSIAAPPSVGQPGPTPTTASVTTVRASRPSWEAPLANGVSIKLIGVSSGESATGLWWRPDGAKLASTPYPEQTPSESGIKPSDYSLYGGKKGDRPFYFVCEITQPLSADVRVSGANTHEAIEDGQDERFRVRSLAFLPAAKHTGSTSVSLAASRWKVIARAPKMGGHYAGKDALGNPFDFRLTLKSLPYILDSTPSGSVIRVEWSGHFGGQSPWQIEVIDHDGHPMDQIVGGETPATSNYHIEFRPKHDESPTLDQVKEVRVEVRPEINIEFTDVALEPGAKKAGS